MLNAMLFGDRTALNHTLRLGFERTGSFHLFVVSGLHIALLAGAVFWLLRLTRTPPLARNAPHPGRRYLLRRPHRLRSARPAISRHGRRLPPSRVSSPATATSLNALGAAALALLLWDPSTLFDASLQMTLLAVIAIAGLAHPIAQRTFLPWAAAARQAFRPRRRTPPPRPRPTPSHPGTLRRSPRRRSQHQARAPHPRAPSPPRPLDPRTGPRRHRRRARHGPPHGPLLPPGRRLRPPCQHARPPRHRNPGPRRRRHLHRLTHQPVARNPPRHDHRRTPPHPHLRHLPHQPSPIR